MKVICIDKPMPLELGAEFPGPEVGDIDVVIFSTTHFKYGALYKLERFGQEWLYSQYHFSLLTDVDEFELVNYKEEYYA